MAQEKETVESTIDIWEVLKALLRKWWLIFIFGVIGGGAMFAYTYFNTTQTYSASIMMYVNASADVTLGNYNFTAGAFNTSTAAIPLYRVIAKRRETLTNVVDNAVIYYADGTSKTLKDKYRERNLDASTIYSYSYLTKNVTVNTVSDTPIFSVTVISTDPEDAIALANAFTQSFPEDVKNIINGTSAKPVEYAVVATPIGRGFTRQTIIGVAVGVVLAAVIIFISDVLVNDTIYSEEWINETFGDTVPLLTVIPEETDSHGKYGYYKYEYRYGYGYYGSHHSSKKKGTSQDSTTNNGEENK